jgi:DNA-binding IclR family transcriptional regulator
MSRPALAATRAVAILDFLAAHPSEGFSLSEIATRLGINLASTHAILATLQESGYISRHGRTRFIRLGPSVVALGSAALEAHPAIDLARDAARSVARETGLEVAVTAVAGEKIVFLARAGDQIANSVPVFVGQRLPFRPPLGSVFAASGNASSWIEESRDRRGAMAMLEAVRRRGFSVALEPDARKGLSSALVELAAHPDVAEHSVAVDRWIEDLGQRNYQLVEIEQKEKYDVSMIASPIFSIDGEATLSLTLLGFSPSLSGEEIIRIGNHLRDACLVVTRQSNGRLPSSRPGSDETSR